MNTPALNPTKTMLSTEIVKIINEMRAEGVAELRHDNFMAKVLKVLGEDNALKFQGIYLDQRNREKPCYHLPKREAQLMVMSESYKVQAAVYDRMVELEEQKPALNPANLTRLQLIEIALQSEQERLLLEDTVKEMQPKVEALDRIATATDGALCPTDAAKMLQVQPKKLIGWLQANKWMYKRAGSRYYVGYQDKIQTGYLEHKEKAIKLADGSDKMTCQVLVTAKGLAKLSGIVSKGGAL